ncbi:MAG: cytochrome D ubiquinol oxidase subunit II [Deltaproteobacteria bacterium]|nr:cytochrome D ubiquinol oxidase subunit II [Deltaproteobacteria bacterium]
MARFGERPDAEPIRQLLVSALRLAREASRSDLKLANNALKELRHAFRIFSPYEGIPKVACFGSARTPLNHPDWQQAHEFAERMVEAGWMVITGAGGGIMGAAQGGAGREQSFGVNIRLPFEQRANEVIAGDRKLINFRYFFTRKVTFVKESHAIALFPGGFGTHDEGFEALTLIQTSKSGVVPVVFVDEPGGSYWRDWHAYVKTHLHTRGLISDEDLSLYRVTDDLDEAVEEILSFYRNYHSSRYVGERLVIRVRQAPDAAQLEALADEFDDILTEGEPVCGAPLPEEKGEVPDLPRVVLGFDRRRIGRLRQLIDRLNDFALEAPSPRDAGPRELWTREFTAEDEQAEEEDDGP